MPAASVILPTVTHVWTLSSKYPIQIIRPETGIHLSITSRLICFVALGVDVGGMGVGVTGVGVDVGRAGVNVAVAVRVAVGIGVAVRGTAVVGTRVNVGVMRRPVGVTVAVRVAVGTGVAVDGTGVTVGAGAVNVAVLDWVSVALGMAGTGVGAGSITSHPTPTNSPTSTRITKPANEIR